jgi:hypothetical protein
MQIQLNMIPVSLSTSYEFKVSLNTYSYVDTVFDGMNIVLNTWLCMDFAKWILHNYGITM